MTNKRSSLVSHQHEEGMNLTYSQSVQPPRPARDWSWERGPNLWTRRSPLELPPISWGSPQIVGGLVQDRLHSQNQTWVNRVNDSDSSYYSIDDLDSSIEIDPTDSLLDHLERGIVPVPEDPGSREPQGLPPVTPGPLSRQWGTPRQSRLDHLGRGVVSVPEVLGSRRPPGLLPVIPGTSVRQWSTPRQPRLARRSDWFSQPQVPLYVSVYDRPRYTTSLGTPVSGATGLGDPSHHQGSPSCRRPRG